MKLSKKVEGLISHWKKSLEIESQFRAVRRDIIKAVKGWDRKKIETLWEEHLKPITEAYEQKAHDAYEQADKYRLRWQTRAWNARSWLMKQASDYVPRGGGNNGGNNGSDGAEPGREHESVSRNTIVFHKPIDPDQWQSALMSLYAEAVRDLSYTPDELDALIATARRSVVR